MGIIARLEKDDDESTNLTSVFELIAPDQLDVRSEVARVKSTLIRRMTAEGWAQQDDSAHRMVFEKQGAGSILAPNKPLTSLIGTSK